MLIWCGGYQFSMFCLYKLLEQLVVYYDTRIDGPEFELYLNFGTSGSLSLQLHKNRVWLQTGLYCTHVYWFD